MDAKVHHKQVSVMKMFIFSRLDILGVSVICLETTYIRLDIQCHVIILCNDKSQYRKCNDLLIFGYTETWLIPGNS